MSAALRPGGGSLVVRGRTAEGAWEQRIQVPPLAEGSGSHAITALFAREEVEDLEMRRAAGDTPPETPRAVARLGVEFQISTRLTSWVAVSEAPTVDPSDPLRRERMPHELPYGMSAEGVGLRPAMAAPVAYAGPAGLPPPPGAASSAASFGGPAAPMPPPPSMPARAPVAKEESAPVMADRVERVVPTRDKAKKVRDVEMAHDAEAPRDAKAPVARTLHGRVALHRAGLLVIEIPAASDLAWTPASNAQVKLVIGHVLAVKVDAGRTTRAGTVSAGATARLALELPAGAPLDAPEAITIVIGESIVTIELR